jgi:hypothetical protein
LVKYGENAMITGMKPGVLLIGLVAALALPLGSAARAESDLAPATYNADAFEASDFKGTLEIIAEERDTIEVAGEGPDESMDRLTFDERGGTLRLDYAPRDFHINSWSSWFGWLGDTDFDADDHPRVVVRVPVGTSVRVHGMRGVLSAGDIAGPFDFSGTGAVRAEVGAVTSARLTGTGATRVSISSVDGPLDVSMTGASRIELGTLNGNANIALTGSSVVRIDAGMAEHFRVRATGASTVSFGGMARVRDISTTGSARVEIGGMAEQSNPGDAMIEVN